MSDDSSAASVLRLAQETHLYASLLKRGSGLLGWWRERKFVAAIDGFAGRLRAVPQAEVERAPADTIRQIGGMVDAIVNDVETFIAGHSGASLQPVERDRHLVWRIYEMRHSFEKLARGVTAQPGMTDLRWEVKLDTAHRDEP